MQNRVPRYPGRIKLTAVDEANGIYDLTRADEPEVEGTPLAKKLLDYAVAACGVTAGTSTAYTLDGELVDGFTLSDGAKVNFKLHVASGAGATLNVNGTGAKPLRITMGGGSPIGLPAGSWVTARYNASADAYVLTGIPGMLPQILCESDTETTFTATNGVDTISVTGTKTALNLPSLGTWTVSATSGGHTTTAAYTFDTIRQESFLIYGPLSSATWEQIANASASGKAAEIWSVGDEIDINVSGETLTLVIVGFNHDDLADGSGKAGITFGMKNLMADKFYMNTTATTIGSFVGSAMYSRLTDTIFPALPSELQAVIKEVNKKTAGGSINGEITDNSMKIFLFSEIEATGANAIGSLLGEGEQYAYFSTTESRVKYLSNGAGAISAWWLRSPIYGNNNQYFARMNTNGTITFGGANTGNGVCFGFCV